MLVVGLGNPGPRYRGSPHNVGFRVVRALAEELGLSWQSRFHSHYASRGGAAPLALLQPQTFMNRSGEAVRLARDALQLTIDQLVVVHDELDLPQGRVKLKQGGGEAGHNGLRSISSELETAQYLRLRIGVGRPPAGEPVADYLLAPLPPTAAAELAPSVQLAVTTLGRLADEGPDRCMAWLHSLPAGRGAPSPEDTSAEVPRKLPNRGKDRL